MHRRFESERTRVSGLGGWLASSVALLLLTRTASAHAQTVAAPVDVGTILAHLPEYGMGIHASVDDNRLQFTGSPYNGGRLST